MKYRANPLWGDCKTFVKPSSGAGSLARYFTYCPFCGALWGGLFASFSPSPKSLILLRFSSAPPTPHYRPTPRNPLFLLAFSGARNWLILLAFFDPRHRPTPFP